MIPFNIPGNIFIFLKQYNKKHKLYKWRDKVEEKKSKAMTIQDDSLHLRTRHLNWFRNKNKQNQYQTTTDACKELKSS
jgi:hypothetical protein